MDILFSLHYSVQNYLSYITEVLSNYYLKSKNLE
mgnify:CR=1 FL=1